MLRENYTELIYFSNLLTQLIAKILTFVLFVVFNPIEFPKIYICI